MTVAQRRDELARILRRGRKFSVEELMNALGTSRRTVLRDLNALRDAGYQIDGEGGPGGGVRMDPTTVLLSGQLTAQEVVGLLMSMALVQASPWIPFAQDAKRAVAKIERSLPPERVRELRRLLSRVLIGETNPAQLDSPVGAVDPQLLTSFERAFREQLLLHFDYRDRNDRPSHRSVEPQALLVRAPVWYMIAWDRDREGLRLFRMDRIRKCHVREDARFELRALSLVLGVCPDAEKKAQLHGRKLQGR